MKASIEQGENLERAYSYSYSHHKGNDFVIIGYLKAISHYNIGSVGKVH